MKRPQSGSLASASAFSLLGGSALFGFLACQSPDAGHAGEAISVRPFPEAGAEKAPEDSVSLRPDPVSGTEPLFVRTGPYEGETCGPEIKARCTWDGTLLRCFEGRMANMWYFDYGCDVGDTVPKWKGMLGFNGLDRAGSPEPVAARFARAVA